MRPQKAKNTRVTPELLQQRADYVLAMGFDKQKWVRFCEELLRDGYELTLYEAKETRSKYVTVRKGGKQFKVRFSDHPAIREREARGDCDFFVGKTLSGFQSSHQALLATRKHFGEDPFAWLEV